MRLVILISNTGTGTNLKAIIDAVNSGKIQAEIVAVVSDKADAPALSHAKDNNLPVEICAKKEALLPLLQKLNPDFICLAGWKQIVLDEVINTFPNKILNLHPGLIPDTNHGTVLAPDGTKALWNKGLLANKAIQSFLDQKASFAGSSIHFLTLEFDFGPVLGRTFEKIMAEDTVDSLYERLKSRENQLYVEILEKLTSNMSAKSPKGQFGGPAPMPASPALGGNKKVLIIGSGSRENALAWKLKQSSRVEKIYIAPGNPGTAQFGENVNIAATDIVALADFAQKNNIDLTVVGPEDPLAAGVVDEFQKRGLKIWGPTKAAAQIESSKVFSKQIMMQAGVPTAEYQTFTDYSKAITYLEQKGAPIVIKASGLALGKGVTVCQTLDEAKTALNDALVKKIFGESGSEVIIEEFLEGMEFSAHAFSDGENFQLLPCSQDHKRIFDGDKGPNTGGVGTIAPLPWMTEKIMQQISKDIVAPILKALKDNGTPFTGLLYPGLILTKTGPKVIEFNCRFGGPECESYMRILKTDLLDILEASVDGKLKDINIEWHKAYACCIILCSKGYPENYQKGLPISGIEQAEKMADVIVFHAGTTTSPHPSPHEGRVADLPAEASAKAGGREGLITNGGRVLGVTAIADDLKSALNKAYSAIKLINFEGMHYRTDIGVKSL